MGDLKLFQFENDKAVELRGMALAPEKPLQLLISSIASEERRLRG